MSSNWYLDKYYHYKDLEFKLTSLKIYEIYFQNNLIGALLLNKAKNISTVSYKKKYKTKYDVNFKYNNKFRNDIHIFDKIYHEFKNFNSINIEELFKDIYSFILENELEFKRMTSV